MKELKNNSSTGASDALWSSLLGLIYFILFCVVTSIGYLLLEDQINEYLNRKTYTPEELEAISKKAVALHSLEQEEANWDRITNGIHQRTGLHDDPDLKIVIAACTSCHSAKLITQNKATREGWQSMIKWMQATQGLPDLGKSEPVILDYLAKYYAPEETGRRKNLNIEEIEWYALNIQESAE